MKRIEKGLPAYFCLSYGDISILKGLPLKLATDIDGRKEKLFQRKFTYQSFKKRPLEEEPHNDEAEVTNQAKKQKIVFATQSLVIFKNFLSKFFKKQIEDNDVFVNNDSFYCVCHSCEKKVSVGYNVNKSQLPSFTKSNLKKHKCFSTDEEPQTCSSQGSSPSLETSDNTDLENSLLPPSLSFETSPGPLAENDELVTENLNISTPENFDRITQNCDTSTESTNV